MINNCPLCSSSDYDIIFEQGSVPVFQNKVYESEADAFNSPTGDVKLIKCNYCGFIYNSSFDSRLMRYDENYQNEQAHSAFFRQHLQNVYQKINHLGLKNKKLIEIGCGKGYFLELLSDNGINITGFDPTYEGNNSNVIKEYFSEKHTGINADVIILRHTLEHIPNPFSFIHKVAKANNYIGHIFIEVPTFDWINKKQAFWDIFYEHCNYFTEISIRAMFNKAEIGSFFGEQYIYCYAELKELKSTIEKQSVNLIESILFDSSVLKWKKFLDEKKNIAIWGAGAKGSTFLNLLDVKKEKIKFVIDINPEKQNKFISHTAHPIYSPKSLKNNEIDNILVMNENYMDEIKQLINNAAIHLYSL